MNVYVTLLDEEIEWATLSPKEQLLLGRLVALKKRHEGAPATDPRQLATDYARAARQEFHRMFPIGEDAAESLKGPLGCVYRDCWYRLYRDALPPEQREEFLRNLRHNPCRLLVDRFLCGEQSQKAFSEEAGFKHSATASRVFNAALLRRDKDNEPGLTLERFRDACEHLQMVPLAGPRSPREATADGFCTTGTYVTGRERLLCVLTAALARCLLRKESCEADTLAACRRLAGLHLARLYGVENAMVLDELTSRFLRDILTVPELHRLDTPGPEGEGFSDPISSRAAIYGDRPFLLADACTERQLQPLLERGPSVVKEPGPEPGGEGELDREFAALLRSAWEGALGACTQWQNSRLFARSTERLARSLHPTESEEAVRQAARYGWGSEEWAHIETCARCRGRLPALRLAAVKLEPAIRFRVKQARPEPAPPAPLAPQEGVAAAPTLLREVPEARDPRVIAEQVSVDGQLEVCLRLESDSLRVTVISTTRMPQLVRCRVQPLAGGASALSRFVLITPKGHVGSEGEVRVRLEKLRALMPLASRNADLEFNFPAVEVVTADRLATLWDEDDGIAAHQVILNKITWGRWDDALLESWREWAGHVARPNGPGRLYTEPIRDWVEKVQRRLNWRAVRAVNRELHDRRDRLLIRAHQSNRGVLAPCISDSLADAGWIFKLTRGDHSFHAPWALNTKHIDWYLTRSTPTVVQHVFESQQGYCCHSRDAGHADDPYYWDYERKGKQRNTLAVPLPRPSSADEAPLGILILESDRPGFSPAQLVDLSVAAGELVPHLLVRENLLRQDPEDDFCPWHPSFNESRGENNTVWNLIDLLEELCHAVGEAVNEAATTCTVWYLDWAEPQGKAFVLATNGYVQDLKVKAIEPLRPDDGRPEHLLARAALVPAGGVYRCPPDKPENAARREEFRAAVRRDFTQQFDMGLEEPVFVPVHLPADRHGGRPANELPKLLLTVCTSTRSVQGNVLDDEELLCLAGRLGKLIDQFQELRLDVARAWLRHHLAAAGRPYRENFETITGVLADMFYKLKDCLIWGKIPGKGWARVRHLAVLPPTDDGLSIALAALLKRYQDHQFTEQAAGRAGDGLRHYEIRLNHPEWQKILDPVEEDCAEPVRVLVHALASGGGATEPDLIFVLVRKRTERPFTDFNERLLAAVAQECLPAFHDWLCYARELRTKPPIEERSLPSANSRSCLAASCLQSLAGRSAGGTARLTFALDTDNSPYYCFAVKPESPGHKQERLYHDPVYHTAASDAAVLNRQQAVYYDVPAVRQRPSEPAHCVRVPFRAWVGHQLARGLLALDFEESVRWTDDRGLSLAAQADNSRQSRPLLFQMARHLAAVFSRDNYPYANGAGQPPEHLGEALLKFIADHCAGLTNAQLLSEDQQPAASEDLKPPQGEGEFGKFWKDEDLRLYGVRFVHCGPRPRILIPLYLDTATRPVAVLATGLQAEPPARLPGAATEAEAAAYRAAIGDYRQKVRTLVGKVAGYWAYLVRNQLLPSATVWTPADGPEGVTWLEPKYAEREVLARIYVVQGPTPAGPRPAAFRPAMGSRKGPGRAGPSAQPAGRRG